MNYKSIIYSLIIAALGFAACQKDDLKQDVSLNEPFDPTWGTGDSIPIYSKFYIKGKFDSVYTAYQDSLQGFKSTVDSISYGPCDTNKNVVGQITTLKDTLTGEGFEIKILSCLINSADSVMNKEEIYERTYPYGSSALTKLTEGVEISWTDKTGTTWTSRRGTGAAENFSFQFLEVLDHDPADSLSDEYVKGHMDLYLYNGSESVRIENTEFSLRIGKY